MGDESIKVANIIEEGRMGGPQYRIIEVAKKLNTEGINTTVIFPEDPLASEFKEKLDKSGIKYIQLKLHRLTRQRRELVKYLIFFFYEIWLITRILSKNRFDLVHVSGGAWQIKGAIAGKLSGCKVVWHLNDSYTPWFVKFIFRCITKISVDGFIVAAERVRRYYFEGMSPKTNKPIFEIQAPVDCEYFDPAVVGFDKRISASQGINIVLIANLNPVKGVEDFLYMAEILNRRQSNLYFWIVGPVYESQKTYFSELQKIKKDAKLTNCFFYGKSEDVRKILKAADIYVCTSKFEASPLSVWEAMSMEKAIVSTDVGDVSRFIKDDFNGYIVPPGEVTELAEKVSHLLDNGKKRKEFGKRARMVAIDKLDIKICVENHKKAYCSVLKKVSKTSV